MRFTDFLRAAVLLFGGAATVLAAVSIAGAKAKDDTTLLYIALGWWALAAAIGGWVGRRRAASSGIAELMASARTTPALPELEPGTVIFNRLWMVAGFTIIAGGLAFLVPQIPAVGVGYALLCALAWRKQAPAVAAVEEREGVRFYVDRTSPFKPTRLVRTPGFQKLEDPAEPVRRAGSTR